MCVVCGKTKEKRLQGECRERVELKSSAQPMLKLEKTSLLNIGQFFNVGSLSVDERRNECRVSRADAQSPNS